MKAIFIKELSGWTGHAELFKCEPPMNYQEYDDDGNRIELQTDYIVVSATVAMFTGAETYIFPADKRGEVINFGELDGSYRGGLSIDNALENAGYEVVR